MDCKHDHPYTTRKSWGPLPSPDREGIDIYEHEVCGCSSLKQFHKWWPKGEWVTKRKDNNYLIFDVPNKYVRKGKYQVVFARNQATIIGALTKDHKRVFFNESFTYSDYKRQKGERTGDW
jgi:hypothetical protein